VYAVVLAKAPEPTQPSAGGGDASGNERGWGLAAASTGLKEAGFGKAWGPAWKDAGVVVLLAMALSAATVGGGKGRGGSEGGEGREGDGAEEAGRGAVPMTVWKRKARSWGCMAGGKGKAQRGFFRWFGWVR